LTGVLSGSERQRLLVGFELLGIHTVGKLKLHMLLPIICAIFSEHSVGAELEYEIRAGAYYSDNVRKADIMQQEETIGLIGLQLDASHESRRVEANLLSDLEYRDYLDDSFDSENIGSVNADVLFKISPDTLSWVVENYYGTLQSDPFRANTPDNRENINVFSTGPDLTLRLPRGAFRISGRYESRYFEVSDIDNDVLGGTVSLVRIFSPNRSVSLNVSADRVEFDDTTVNSDFDRQTAYLGFNSQNSRGSIVVNLGINEIHDFGEVSRGTLVGISWSRNITARSSFSLGYDQRFSDAGDIFKRFQAPGRGFGNVRAISGVSDPFENRRFSAKYNNRRKNFDFYVTAFRDEQVYEISKSLNRDRTRVGVGASKSLGSAWQVSIGARFQKTEFSNSSRVDDDIDLRGRISRKLSRRVSLNIGYARSERDSNTAGFDYIENVASLTFSYTR